MGNRALLLIVLMTTAAFVAGEAGGGPYTAEYLYGLLDASAAVRESEAGLLGMARKAETAGRLGDTIVRYELMDAPEAAMLAHRLAVSQEIPLGGKLRLGREIARSEYTQAVAMLAETKLDLRLELRKALSEFHYAEAVLDIRRQELATLQGILSLVQGRYLTGGSSLSDLNRLKLAIERARSMTVDMENMSRLVANEINGLTNTDLDPARLRRLEPRPSGNGQLSTDRSSLTAMATERFPALRAAGVNIDLARLNEKYAGLELVPDLMAELSYTLKPGNNWQSSISAGISVNLPLFSRSSRQAEVGMATARVQEAEARQAALRQTVATAVGQRTIQAENLARRVAIFENSIRPLLAADLETRLSNYTLGRSEIEMVLEATLMTYDSEIENLQDRLGLTQALFELEYLTGETFITFEDGRL